MSSTRFYQWKAWQEGQGPMELKAFILSLSPWHQVYTWTEGHYLCQGGKFCMSPSAGSTRCFCTFKPNVVIVLLFLAMRSCIVTSLLRRRPWCLSHYSSDSQPLLIVITSPFSFHSVLKRLRTSAYQSRKEKSNKRDTLSQATFPAADLQSGGKFDLREACNTSFARVCTA